ncbi:MAG: citramalate synthase [Armatimonadota bacterium]
MPRKVQVFDTTLRDGCQAEEVAFSVHDKLEIARRLDAVGVDYIEGGWPNETNPRDTEFFQEARERLELKHAKLTAFGSTRRASVTPEEDANLRCLLEAETPTVAIFGKSWDLHVTDVIRCSLEDNLAMIEDSVAHLRSAGREVIFDAEHYFDGFAANPDYAVECLRAAERGGAVCLVLCDTNGGTVPSHIQTGIEAAKGAVSTPLGIHVHDDSGMAVANTVIAVEMGIDHVQGTINGYGERCGNANLCSLIPTIELKLGARCLPDGMLQELRELSLYVAAQALIPHNHRQPYIGASAFAHKGGMHIDAVMKTPQSFEHVEPELVGNERRVLLSDQAGGAAILHKLQHLRPGLQKSDPAVGEMLSRVKQLEHEGYQFEAAEGSFELLAKRVLGTHRGFFDLHGFRVTIEAREDGQTRAEATVRLAVDGDEVHTAAMGTGPVNALDGALRKALEQFYPQLKDVALASFKVWALGEREGTAAKVRVLIHSSDGEAEWGTVGAHTDIIAASWQALVESIEYKLLQEDDG